MVRAERLPTAIAHAFIDAIEAWSDLEHELFMTWQFLNDTADFNKAWLEFSSMSTQRQIDQTEKVVSDYRSSVTSELFGRLRDLKEKRNRIVHGRWNEMTVEEGRKRYFEYNRIYEARGAEVRPLNEEDEQRMRGRSRFYEADLRAAEN